jgi:protein required for attachment to host cells
MLAKPNYQFEKRQRDIANKKKKEEKRQKKLEKSQASSSADPDQSLNPAADVDQPADKGTE